MKAVSRFALAAALLAAAALWTGAALAQQILIDKPVRAGELVCFPDLNNPMSYYYVNDKPHLAVGEDGKPHRSCIGSPEWRLSPSRLSRCLESRGSSRSAASARSART